MSDLLIQIVTVTGTVTIIMNALEFVTYLRKDSPREAAASLDSRKAD